MWLLPSGASCFNTTLGGTTTHRPSISARIPLAEAADAVARLEKKIGDPIRLVLVP